MTTYHIYDEYLQEAQDYEFLNNLVHLDTLSSKIALTNKTLQAAQDLKLLINNKIKGTILFSTEVIEMHLLAATFPSQVGDFAKGVPFNFQFYINLLTGYVYVIDLSAHLSETNPLRPSFMLRESVIKHTLKNSDELFLFFEGIDAS